VILGKKRLPRQIYTKGGKRTLTPGLRCGEKGSGVNRWGGTAHKNKTPGQKVSQEGCQAQRGERRRRGTHFVKGGKNSSYGPQHPVVGFGRPEFNCFKAKTKRVDKSQRRGQKEKKLGSIGKKGCTEEGYFLPRGVEPLPSSVRLV